MGYCVTQTDSNFKIEKKKMLSLKGIETFLENNGFDCKYDENGNITEIYYQWENYSNDIEECLNEISNFIEEGSYIEFCDEHGSLFRLKLVNGEFKKIYPKIIWEE
ncbi:MAG: hypothetical protein ACRCW9_03935 [Cetobacterium sp.]